MKFFLFFALLAIPAAQGAPRSLSANKAASLPPKARVVENHPKTEKLYVSTSGASSTAKGKPAASKVVPSSPTANDWHLTPKFEEGGKDDTTYGFLLKRRF